MSFSLSEYTKIDVVWGKVPTGGAYSAPTGPVAGFKGAARGRRGMEGKEGKD